MKQIKTLILLPLLTAVLPLTMSASNMPEPCSGRIERKIIRSPQFNENYTVDIWLPSSYSDQCEPFPVIYMQDGQNLFDPKTVWNGQEWGIDEAVSALSEAGITDEAVIVGIHNKSTRFADYMPENVLSGHSQIQNKLMAAYGLEEIRGNRYADFIANTVMPYVAQNYNVSDQREHVSAMGSSMGGLISIYLLCEYPDLFGAAACLSTHWSGTSDSSTPEFADACLEYLDQNLPDAATHRIYLDHGTVGLDALYRNANDRVVALALSKGYTKGKNLVSFIAEGADHNENCWRQRLGRPLRLLIPGEVLINRDRNLPSYVPDGVILHCFCWKLKDIETELPNIAAAGFTAVQTSPMERNVNENDVWYDVYRPYDYRFIDNAMGSRQDMIDLCREAKKYGINIIVDIVANHGTGSDEAHDPWWDVNGRMRWGTGSINWNDRYSETHDELGGYGDSNSEDPEVQQRTLDYVRDLKSLGVAGLRWDAAKHIPLPSENCEFWNVVLSEPGIWSYGEVLGMPAGDNGASLLREYTSLMSVTDPGMTGNYEHEGHYWHGINPDRLLYWAESHDTYCNAGETVNKTENEIDRRWALVASRKGATALYFSRPFEKANNRIKTAAKGSTHFTSKEVTAVNHFHNAMGALPEMFAEVDGAKAVYRTKGVVIVKDGGGNVSLPATNLDPDISYKDEITGSIFRIGDGKITGTVDPVSGIAVVYDYENPPVPAPYVATSSSGEIFSDPGYTLTLSAHYALSAAYTIGDSEPVHFNGEVKIPLGKIMQKGEIKQISWTAYGVECDTSGAASFRYTENVDEQVKVLLHFDDPDWGGKFYTYIYTPQGVSNAGWPGELMKRDDSITAAGITGGWYCYDVPDSFKVSGLVLVSNNGPNRYPGANEPGIPLYGKSLAFIHHGGEWIVQNISLPSSLHASPVAHMQAGECVPVGYYTLMGQRIEKPIPGQICIVRHSDGTVRKQIF